MVKAAPAQKGHVSAETLGEMQRNSVTVLERLLWQLNQLFISSLNANLGGLELILMTTGILIMVMGYYTRN